MKKLTFIFVILYLVTAAKAQELNFVWVSNVNTGDNETEVYLNKVIKSINSRNDLAFVIVTGNLTVNGSTEQYDKVKDLLSRMKLPGYILPGKNDTENSTSADVEYREYLGNENFVFDVAGKRFIGINSSLFRHNTTAHFSPENIKWLQEILDTTGTGAQVYLICNNPLDSTIDNWFAAANLLAGRNIKVILAGSYSGTETAVKNKIININGFPTAFGRQVKEAKTQISKKKKHAKPIFTSGYTIITVKEDSIYFTEVEDDSSAEQWGSISLADEINYKNISPPETRVSSDSINIKWQQNLQASCYAPLLFSGDRIFAVTKDGLLYCYGMDGKLRWEYDTGGTIITAPVRDGDVLSVATWQGDLFSFNANNGMVLQVLSTGENLTSDLIKIILDFNGQKFVGTLMGTASGKMLCYNMYTLEELWENTSATDVISCSPLVIDGKIIYSSRDNILYCIDAKSGILNWKWANKDAPGAFINSNFLSDGKHIFIRSAFNEISSIDMLLGVPSWKKSFSEKIFNPGISKNNDCLLIPGTSGKLYFVSLSDGKILKEFIGEIYDAEPAMEPFEWRGSIYAPVNGRIINLQAPDANNEIFDAGSVPVIFIQNISENTLAVSTIDGGMFLLQAK